MFSGATQKSVLKRLLESVTFTWWSADDRSTSSFNDRGTDANVASRWYLSVSVWHRIAPAKSCAFLLLNLD